MKENVFFRNVITTMQVFYMYWGPNDDDDDLPEEWTD